MLKLPALLVLAITVFATTQAHAVSLEFRGKPGQVWKVELPLQATDTVGSLTIRALDQFKAQGKIQKYNGYESGLVSVNDLGNDTEVISDTVMKAYGWCFDLNGVESNKMPDQIRPSKSTDKVLWYWAYAYYDREWKQMCVPVAPQRN